MNNALECLALSNNDKPKEEGLLFRAESSSYFIPRSSIQFLKLDTSNLYRFKVQLEALSLVFGKLKPTLCNA